MLGGVALHALLGWSAVWLPSTTSGASRDWLWGAAGAVVLGGLRLAAARWPAARPASSSLVRCALALCAAASIDFSISAPDRLLSVCSADTSWDAQFTSLIEHLGACPVSGAAMVGLVLFEFTGGQGRASFFRAALAVAAMLAAMSFAMGALPWLARSMQWPWTADALVFSMICSMLLLHLLPLQPQRRNEACPYREFPA
ncbi:hypothetical protein EEB15_12450 [Ramlibacter sp. WS9]|nr:hypothetical protein EEB15_12450 [Ramlibacter sp. WS9]